jgi:hypothetical protein
MWERVVLALLFAAIVAGAVAAAQRQDVFDRIRTSTDVAWLEAIAGDDVSAESIAPRGYKASSVRGVAYVRLGAIGSADAVAAIARVEARAAAGPILPETVSLERWAHAAPHFSDATLTPLVTATLPSGAVVGLLRAQLLGGDDLFLIRGREVGRWSRPRLIDRRYSPGPDPPALQAVSETELRFRFDQVPLPEYQSRRYTGIDSLAPALARGAQEWRLQLGEIERDSDGDGWTDAEEERLGLNSVLRDTDGDGVEDGRDVCPGYAPAPGEASDEAAIILGRAAFAVYGVNRSQSAILVTGSRPVQLRGFRGPVIYGLDRDKWIGTHQRGFVFVKWQITSRTADTAKVELDDYEAALAAAGFEVTLKRIHGQWVVVESRMRWIS